MRPQFEFPLAREDASTELGGNRNFLAWRGIKKKKNKEDDENEENENLILPNFVRLIFIKCSSNWKRLKALLKIRAIVKFFSVGESADLSDAEICSFTFDAV